VVLGASGAATIGWGIANPPSVSLPPAVAFGSLALAVLIVVWAYIKHVLSAPIVLVVVPLLLAVAASMQPITQIISPWTDSEVLVAILIALAPAAGIAAASLAGRSFGQRETIERPRSSELLVAVTLMFLVGASVLIWEFHNIGGPPLLSGSVDEARFSLVTNGSLHLLTDGISLSMLIATWARIGHANAFSPTGRRVLECVICGGLVLAALGGGRSTLFFPLIACALVAYRGLGGRRISRYAILGAAIFLVASAGLFVLRVDQQRHNEVSDALAYDPSGESKSLPRTLIDVTTFSFGYQPRVVLEFRESRLEQQPATYTLWFAHSFVHRARDPQDVAKGITSYLLTSGYAGPILLDFSLAVALGLGILLGIAAQLLYIGYRNGKTVFVWVYAYAAGPLALSFYLNAWLYFAFVWIDILVLIIAARLLVDQPRAARYR
jgi:hypothetical protein